MFDGPVANLLSVLCILLEVLSRAHAKREKNLNDFEFGTFVRWFSERHTGKHGSERVNTVAARQLYSCRH